MQNTRRHNWRGVVIGLALGIAATGFFGNILAQTGTAQPVKSDTQYFVTGEGDEAHLWVREGTNLRCVGHGECKAHSGHKHGDGHDHDKAKEKP